VLLLEFLVPIGLLVAILGLQQIVKPTIIDKLIPSEPRLSPTIDDLYDLRYCTFDTLVWRCPQENCRDPGELAEDVCQIKKIAVAPADSADAAAKTAAQDMVAWANNNYAGASVYKTFTYFDSESSFVNYMSQEKYSTDLNTTIYSSAVIFNKGYPSWDYVLRFNKTQGQGVSRDDTAPDTNLPVLDINSKSGYTDNTLSHIQEYMNSYYFTLSDTVNSYITTSTCENSGRCTIEKPQPFVTIGVAEFPNEEAKYLGFWSLIGFSFALVMIVGIMYPLANIISALVREKESKIREGMMMMALHGGTYY
jgi:ATP-binding cassette, subfamily A (ABC1), member 3